MHHIIKVKPVVMTIIHIAEGHLRLEIATLYR